MYNSKNSIPKRKIEKSNLDKHVYSIFQTVVKPLKGHLKSKGKAFNAKENQMVCLRQFNMSLHKITYSRI